MTADRPRVVFVARRLPPAAVGGMEQLSFDVRSVLAECATVEDLSNTSGARVPLRYLATLRSRIRRATRGDNRCVIDGSDATLAYAVTATGNPSALRVVGLDLLYRNPVYQRVMRRYLPRADAIVPCSRATGEIAKGLGVPDERIHVILPAAREPAPGVTAERDLERVLFVGRLVRRKGIVPFVEHIWPRVVKGHPSATLQIIGDGPERSRLEAAVAARVRKGDSSIRYDGRVDRQALELAYAKARVFVMNNIEVPGDWEGFGIVAAEAAMRGVPVVGTRMQGLEDSIRDGHTGTLVAPGDTEAFAGAVLKVLGGHLSDAASIRQTARRLWGIDRLRREYCALVTSLARR